MAYKNKIKIERKSTVLLFFLVMALMLVIIIIGCTQNIEIKEQKMPQDAIKIKTSQGGEVTEETTTTTIPDEQVLAEYDDGLSNALAELEIVE